MGGKESERERESERSFGPSHAFTSKEHTRGKKRTDPASRFNKGRHALAKGGEGTRPGAARTGARG